MTESDQGTARRGLSGAAQRSAGSGSASRSGGATTVSRTSASGRTEERKGRAPAAATPERARNGAARERSRSGQGTQTSGQPVAAKKAARKPRRARLRLTQVDAWSVMKTAFLLSIAMGIVSVVAVGIVWGVLGAAGVWDSLNSTVQTVMGNSFQVQDYIGTGRVLGFTMLFSVVNVILLTAIATLGAFLYNLSATLLGGLELTLTEDG